MINSQSLVGLTHQEAVDVLRSTAGLIQLVVASKVLLNLGLQIVPVSKGIHLDYRSSNAMVFVAARCNYASPTRRFLMV